MLKITSLDQVIVKDEPTNRSLQNIANALNPVLQNPIVNNTVVTNVVIPSNGKLVISHGLGRPPMGAIVTKSNAAVPTPYVSESDQTTPNSAITLTFSSGAGATVSVLVF